MLEFESFDKSMNSLTQKTTQAFVFQGFNVDFQNLTSMTQTMKHQFETAFNKFIKKAEPRHPRKASMDSEILRTIKEEEVDINSLGGGVIGE